jgi:hypothetical protein
MVGILTNVSTVAKFSKAQLTNMGNDDCVKMESQLEDMELSLITRQLFMVVKKSSGSSRTCWRDGYD